MEPVEKQMATVEDVHDCALCCFNKAIAVSAGKVPVAVEKRAEVCAELIKKGNELNDIVGDIAAADFSKRTKELQDVQSKLSQDIAQIAEYEAQLEASVRLAGDIVTFAQIADSCITIAAGLAGQM